MATIFEDIVVQITKLPVRLYDDNFGTRGPILRNEEAF